MVNNILRLSCGDIEKNVVLSRGDVIKKKLYHMVTKFYHMVMLKMFRL